MAEYTFYVETERVINTAGKLQEIMAGLNSSSNTLCNTIANISKETWTAGSRDQMIETMLPEFKKGINTMQAMIDEHAEDMKTQARNYEQAEQEADSLVKGNLDGDVVR